MKRFFRLLLVIALVAPGLAEAACFADYKAKRDNPLKLHYGVARITDGDCPNRRQAAEILGPRLARDGWTLLTVVSVFGEGELEAKRGESGNYFLRY